MNDAGMTIVLVLVAVGFYCLGWLHSMTKVQREVVRIFRNGYKLGRRHGAERGALPPPKELAEHDEAHSLRIEGPDAQIIDVLERWR